MSSRLTAPEPSPLPLPAGIKSRQIDLSHIGHLSYHILEAGGDSSTTTTTTKPLIILLHGFPELAYSWRKTILPLAVDAGYHVIAPDQRGFGRTTGWDTRPYREVDLHTFSPTMLVRDIIVLVSALGYKQVKCVVGHDIGAVTAANCAVMRPDIFQSVLLLTHPFSGLPDLPFGIQVVKPGSLGLKKRGLSAVNNELAALGRKHCKCYYSSKPANADMTGPITPGGLRAFFRGFFHVKSASWAGNDDPRPLKEWSAKELLSSRVPEYYIMPLPKTMPETIHELMASESSQARELSKQWLPDDELEVYVSEYARTSFQGGLNWYRVWTAEDGNSRTFMQDLDVFSGLKIKVPCAFIGGEKDWGTYQEPGAIEKMRDGKEVCEDFRFCKIIQGAGHWIPQEKPEEVVQGILELVRGV